MGDYEKIQGSIESIVYRNEENGYTILRIVSSGVELTCVGIFGQVRQGDMICASGKYTTHPLYGRQFSVSEYEYRPPESLEAIERYLASGAIRGIKKALASRITKAFGDDTMRIMDEEPERLAEVKGISLRKACDIGKQYAEKAGMRSAMMFLQKFGISMNLASRIYQKYKENVYTVVRENPYRLAEDIKGIGFRAADRIAMSVGIKKDSLFRIQSAIIFILEGALSEGNIYLKKDMLISGTRELISIECDIENAFMELVMNRKLVLSEKDGEHIVYLSKSFEIEKSSAAMLSNLAIEFAISDARVHSTLDEVEKELSENGILPDRQQSSAVISAAKNGVCIITGGPGTGKTTTINMIISFFVHNDLTVMLAAPTGRAAKRMTEATGYAAQTIHRLLEVSNISDDSAHGTFLRNRDNPLETDVVIIDEVSMVDEYILHSLLCAMTPGMHLILVGDVDQLPSVGPGSVLKDMISSGCFACVMLKSIFRQAAKSDIVMNAHKINLGESILLDNKSEDFFFLEMSDHMTIKRAIVSLVLEKMPRYVNAKPYDIQILTPMRKGEFGVEQLNAFLQRYLNPPSAAKSEFFNGKVTFRENDKVMQIRNNYQIAWEIKGLHGIVSSSGTGIFNGDVGIVQNVNGAEEILTVCFDDGRCVKYPFTQLDDLELAYAITIHKSQGSEYPAVVLPLLSGPQLLMNRNLLYTAVTRAKRCVTIIGRKHIVDSMINNKTKQERNTSLADRILEMFHVAD